MKKIECEIWKIIPNFEYYEVSNLGNVRVLDKYVESKNGSQRFIKGKLLKFKKSKDGSLRVGIYQNRKQYFFFIHKLVAITFIDNNENKQCIIHLDRDNKNNRVENLKWATWEEVREMAQYSQRLSGKIFKLNNHRSIKCKMKKQNGIEIEYNSISEAARKNNMDIENIHHAVSGRYKKAYGLEWLLV